MQERQRSGAEDEAIRTTEVQGREPRQHKITQLRQEMAKLRAAVERLMAGGPANMNHKERKEARAKADSSEVQKREVPRTRQPIKRIPSDGRAPGEMERRSRSLQENGVALSHLYYKRSAIPLPLQQKKKLSPFLKLLNVRYIIIYIIIPKISYNYYTMRYNCYMPFIKRVDI